MFAMNPVHKAQQDIIGLLTGPANQADLNKAAQLIINLKPEMISANFLISIEIALSRCTITPLHILCVVGIHVMGVHAQVQEGFENKKLENAIKRLESGKSGQIIKNFMQETQEKMHQLLLAHGKEWDTAEESYFWNSADFDRDKIVVAKLLPFFSSQLGPLLQCVPFQLYFLRLMQTMRNQVFADYPIDKRVEACIEKVMKGIRKTPTHYLFNLEASAQLSAHLTPGLKAIFKKFAVSSKQEDAIISDIINNWKMLITKTQVDTLLAAHVRQLSVAVEIDRLILSLVPENWPREFRIKFKQILKSALDNFFDQNKHVNIPLSPNLVNVLARTINTLKILSVDAIEGVMRAECSLPQSSVQALGALSITTEFKNEETVYSQSPDPKNPHFGQKSNFQNR